MTSRVLVVDRDPQTGPQVSRALAGTAETIAIASVDELGDERPDLVLLDVGSTADDPLGAITRLRAAGVDAPVLLLTAGPPPLVALGGAGARDFLGKPLHPLEAAIRIERALREREARTEERERRPRKSDVLVGASSWTKALHERIAMVAPTDVSVALSGESGTGKELVARTIHALSGRAAKPFVAVNCGAIPEPLLEDELFGHVRGAFTDASHDRQGLVQAADTGTLFLDEIGEMSPGLQVKLLRFLQSHELRRLGDDKTIKVDVRVLTATNRDLELAVREGRFREDLYYRINVFPLRLAPLRERQDDIPILAQHFLLRHRERVGKRVSGFTSAAIDKLATHPWPGNVRELENRIHHALVLAQENLIDAIDLDLDGGGRRAAVSGLTRRYGEAKRAVIDEFDLAYVREALRRAEGNLAAAARASGMDRKNFWALVKKTGVIADDFRPGGRRR